VRSEAEARFESSNMAKNKKRGNGEGTSSSSSPPLKRQKTGGASSATAVSDEMAARNLLLEQRLQSSEDEVARLQGRLQLQEEEVQRLHQQEEANNQRWQLQEEENNQRLHALNNSTFEGFRRCGLSFNGKTTDIDIIDNLTRLSPLAMHYNANVTNQFIRDIPEMLWWQKILQPFLNLEDLSILRCTNTFFQTYWESVLKQNVIRVPQGCPTMKQAMELAVMFSERNECTRENPVKVEVGEGEHESRSVASNDYRSNFTHVRCNNITIVGKGKGKTTILGGFWVDGKQNVKIEQLCASGNGLICRGSGTNVDVTECSFTKCKYDGVSVDNGAIVTATRCEVMENSEGGVRVHDANTKVTLNECTIHHNEHFGLFADIHAVVDLHGTTTNIHSNEGNGIVASRNAKISIHLPFQHNTSHGNGEDRQQDNGGSIANINADGTFTHVEDVDTDDYDY
jgi:hypothetical protein